MKFSGITTTFLALATGTLALPTLSINDNLVGRDGGEGVAVGENNPATDYVIPIDKRQEPTDPTGGSPATDYVIPIDKRDEPAQPAGESPATDYVIPIDKRQEPTDPTGGSPATDYVIPIDK
ncbi:Ribosomally synthesized cyclic peptide ustiloxin B precursosr [Colletotrichum sidae]|uniref:Ribosomally synthesized cyclic peptide ustiloxin B precursosr n=1 Tax=Colletotrichum sidae TaxID=1347389 RepID=A0A4R8TKH9_9PEZI|nr:Ribosomally synthesized cyclic peptide ustiloxin B precursosr [Colletotrichum sidae]